VNFLRVTPEGLAIDKSEIIRKYNPRPTKNSNKNVEIIH
jgi:hypothetical protein